MTTDNSEHHPDCGWWSDWHTCTCGAYDEVVCDGCGRFFLNEETHTLTDENLSGIVLCKECMRSPQGNPPNTLS